MARYKSILVPLDMSEDSFCNIAASHALDLLAQGGTLHFVSVLPGYSMPMVGSFFPAGAFDTAVKEAKRILEGKVNEFLKGSEHKAQLHVLEGKPASVILKKAKQVNADLIVMASHKHSKLDKVTLGSIANKVVSRAKIPVLVVKSG